MQAYLNHTAFDVKDYDWYKNFFTNICGMNCYREIGESPKRQMWFVEGIQLNESEEDMDCAGNAFNHIGLLTEDVDAFVAEAIRNGCSPLPGKSYWFVMPNKLKVEVKQIGKVPER